jgi:hypothetical protein
MVAATPNGVGASAPFPFMLWKKPNGIYIKTNDKPETIAHAVRLGWREASWFVRFTDWIKHDCWRQNN